MINTQDVMGLLEAAGSAQTRKIYARHGARGPMFGVSYAVFEKLRKQIKINHEIALGLWASGNHDARTLAMMIADPKQADNAMLEAWVGALDDYGSCDALSKYVAKTHLAREKAEQWITSDSEWISTTGWDLIGLLALQDKTLADAYFLPHIDTIEQHIHTRKNRTRYAMNSALIAIGGRGAGLSERALAAAAAIGTVEVDHGETNCKTPVASEYIQKMLQRKNG
jgi:3-methyladenine DNA glycosylase AlkD